MVKPRRAAESQGELEAKVKTVPTHLLREHWFLLRKVALLRSMKEGGRVTLGSVLAEVIERHRKELEKELGE